MGDYAPLVQAGVEVVGEEAGLSEATYKPGEFKPYESGRSWSQWGSDWLKGGEVQAQGEGIKPTSFAKDALKTAKNLIIFHEAAKEIGTVAKDIVHPKTAPPPTTPNVPSPLPNPWDRIDYTPPPINIQVYGGPGAGVPKYPHEPVHRGRRPKSHHTNHSKGRK